MFPTARYIQNSFTITFPRQAKIRRKANDFEDSLTGIYSSPQVLPVPDEFEPGMPRMIFESDHGYSQIVVSQVNISLNVRYSPDWQIDIEKGKIYLLERANILFNLVEIVEVQPSFCGLLTNVRLATDQSDNKILEHIANKMLKDENINSLIETLIKRTFVIKDHFFSHLTVGNYRSWNLPTQITSIPRFINSQASEKGIEIQGDFNDRFAFNEQEDYHTNRELTPELINQGIEQMQDFVVFMME